MGKITVNSIIKLTNQLKAAYIPNVLKSKFLDIDKLNIDYLKVHPDYTRKQFYKFFNQCSIKASKTPTRFINVFYYELYHGTQYCSCHICKAINFGKSKTTLMELRKKQSKFYKFFNMIKNLSQAGRKGARAGKRLRNLCKKEN